MNFKNKLVLHENKNRRLTFIILAILFGVVSLITAIDVILGGVHYVSFAKAVGNVGLVAGTEDGQVHWDVLTEVFPNFVPSSLLFGIPMIVSWTGSLFTGFVALTVFIYTVVQLLKPNKKVVNGIFSLREKVWVGGVVVGWLVIALGLSMYGVIGMAATEYVNGIKILSLNETFMFMAWHSFVSDDFFKEVIGISNQDMINILRELGFKDPWLINQMLNLFTEMDGNGGNAVHHFGQEVVDKMTNEYVSGVNSLFYLQVHTNIFQSIQIFVLPLIIGTTLGSVFKPNNIWNNKLFKKYV